MWENEIHSFAFLFGDCCNTRLHLKDIVALSWPSIRTSAESFLSFYPFESVACSAVFALVQVPAELYYNSTIVLNGSDNVLYSVLSDRIISDFFHATCHGVIMFLSSFIPKLVFIYSKHSFPRRTTRWQWLWQDFKTSEACFNCHRVQWLKK